MLGKGLESLIPKKGGGSGGDAPAGPGPGVPPDDGSTAAGSVPASAAEAEREEAPIASGTEPLMLFTHEEEKELPEGEDMLLPEGVPGEAPPAGSSATAAASGARKPGEAARATPPEESRGPGWLPPRRASGDAARGTVPRERPAAKPYEAVFHIETAKIKPNPRQPRRIFNPESLRELAHSIREFGILQPLVVVKKEIEVPTGTDVEYELIAGERRLEAAKLLGLERVPAIIRNVDLERERLEMAIIENIQREDLSPIEAARAFSRLQDEFRLTQREIASRLGKARETIANTVRLLDLPPAIQEAVDRKQVTESHGRLLLSVTDPAAQERLFRDLLGQKMTTREFKRKVEAARDKGHAEEAADPELAMIQEKLSSDLGAPVKISRSGETGKITITFYSQEELNNILDKLKAGE